MDDEELIQLSDEAVLDENAIPLDLETDPTDQGEKYFDTSGDELMGREIELSEDDE